VRGEQREIIIGTPHGGSRAPWIVASVLGVVAIALGAVVLFVIHPDRDDKQEAARAVGLTSTAQQAMDAASKQVINLTTYSRKAFEADYARAMSGATGDLLGDLQKADNKTNLLKQMQDGKFDLQGEVTNVAFEESSGDKYLVLISSNGYKVPDGAQRSLQTRARFEVTMIHSGSKWLASTLTSVGLI